MFTTKLIFTLDDVESGFDDEVGLAGDLQKQNL